MNGYETKQQDKAVTEMILLEPQKHYRKNEGGKVIGI